MSSLIMLYMTESQLTPFSGAAQSLHMTNFQHETIRLHKTCFTSNEMILVCWKDYVCNIEWTTFKKGVANPMGSEFVS